MNPQTKQIAGQLLGLAGDALARIGRKAQDAAVEAGVDEAERLADKLATGARKVADRLRERRRRFEDE